MFSLISKRHYPSNIISRWTLSYLFLKMAIRAIIILPAERVKFGFPVQTVAILADSIETGKDALVIEPFTVDVKEGAFWQRMGVTGCGHGRRWVARKHCQKNHQCNYYGQQGSWRVQDGEMTSVCLRCGHSFRLTPIALCNSVLDKTTLKFR